MAAIMTPAGVPTANTVVAFKNILYLTDFSEPSEAALPFALAIGRGYGAKLHALHVLIPTAYSYTTPDLMAVAMEAEEEVAQAEMRKVESQLAGLRHESIIERGTNVWDSVKGAIAEQGIDLIVLGTHGRTGAQKLLLGSVAEELFRRSPVPVLTIGPGAHSNAHNGARFHRLLFATDFSPEAQAAAVFAGSLAQKGSARLILLHVVRRAGTRTSNDSIPPELSAAEAIHQLYDTPLHDAGFNSPPEVAVEYGDPADRIVETARRRGADLIVLGIRDAANTLGAGTHLGGRTAHKVVAHAPCPVLTVRG